MRDACGLAGCSGGGHRPWSGDLAGGGVSGAQAGEAAGLFDAQLAIGKGPQPRDGITGAAIPRGFRLEESQNPLRAVRRPRREDPTISFAERLWRTHTQILSRVWR